MAKKMKESKDKFDQAEESLQAKEQAREQQRPEYRPQIGPRRGHPNFGTGEKAVLLNPRNLLWRWIFSYLRPFMKAFVGYFLLLLLSTVLSAVSPIITSRIIDVGIVGKNQSFLLTFSGIYVILMIIMAIVNYISSYGMGKIGQVITRDVRNDIFDQLQKMSMGYFDRRNSGDIISITTNDVDQLNQLVSGNLVQLISSFASIGLTIVFMYVLNPILATASLVVFPIFFILIKIFTKVISGAFKTTRKTISKVTSSIEENISGARVVQAYGQEKKATNEFDQANTENYAAMVRVRKIFSTFFPLVQFITQIITASILLLGGFVYMGHVSLFGVFVTVGVLTAYITFLAQFFRPFLTLIQIQNVIESAMAATDRIYTLVHENVDLPDPDGPVELKNVKGIIDFNDVSFGYRFNGNALNNGENAKIEAEKSSLVSDIKSNIKSKLKITSLKKTKKSSHEREEVSEKSEKYGAEKPFENKMKIDHEKLMTMSNNLEKMLNKKNAVQMSTAGSGGGMGGEMGSGGGNMSGRSGMPEDALKGLLRMMATIEIPEPIFNQFPKIVQKAIKEEKKLIEHEMTVGYVLKDVDLHVDPGSTIAIVGETGAGKTTMTKLIMRFYDTNKGIVTIDGVDVSKMNKKDLRDAIGLVPQDSFIFTGTIKDNLLYGIDNPTPDDEKRMYDISEFLGLHNFIEALPEKYETVLIENGSNISIGQRQLIAFARALIAEPKILILDEATSSVDPYTETLIQDALDRARKGRTTIIIAHRLSTIKNADHIVVIGKEEKGIIEQGTHESLMKLEHGRYRKLLEMQYKDVQVSD